MSDQGGVDPVNGGPRITAVQILDISLNALALVCLTTLIAMGKVSFVDSQMIFLACAFRATGIVGNLMAGATGKR